MALLFALGPRSFVHCSFLLWHIIHCTYCTYNIYYIVFRITVVRWCVLQDFWPQGFHQVVYGITWSLLLLPHLVNIISKLRKKIVVSQQLSGPNSQIREQMSGPEISWYGKSILCCGLWPGLDCGKKGSGLIMSILPNFDPNPPRVDKNEHLIFFLFFSHHLEQK